MPMPRESASEWWTLVFGVDTTVAAGLASESNPDLLKPRHVLSIDEIGN